MASSEKRRKRKFVDGEGYSEENQWSMFIISPYTSNNPIFSWSNLQMNCWWVISYKHHYQYYHQKESHVWRSKLEHVREWEQKQWNNQPQNSQGRHKGLRNYICLYMFWLFMRLFKTHLFNSAYNCDTWSVIEYFYVS